MWVPQLHDIVLHPRKVNACRFPAEAGGAEAHAPAGKAQAGAAAPMGTVNGVILMARLNC
jgi:hypothetical protein